MAAMTSHANALFALSFVLRVDCMTFYHSRTEFLLQLDRMSNQIKLYYPSLVKKYNGRYKGGIKI